MRRARESSIAGGTCFNCLVAHVAHLTRGEAPRLYLQEAPASATRYRDWRFRDYWRYWLLWSLTVQGDVRPGPSSLRKYGKEELVWQWQWLTPYRSNRAG